MATPLEDEIFYPESDGKPMAETEDHLEELVYEAEEKFRALEQELKRLRGPGSV